MARDEIRLRGGWMQKVVRVGDTVRRAPRGDVAFVRELLARLEAAGFADAPRWLGTDNEGRDILSFVEGKVPPALGYFDDAALAAAARLIRRYHDATAPFFEDGRVRVTTTSTRATSPSARASRQQCSTSTTPPKASGSSTSAAPRGPGSTWATRASRTRSC